mgnify:CR=1 FL=1
MDVIICILFAILGALLTITLMVIVYMTAYSQGKKAAIKELREQIELPEESKEDEEVTVATTFDGKYYSTTRTIQLMEEEGDEN